MMPRIPQYCAPEIAMNVENAAGAMKLAARPVVAYSPKISDSRPAGMRRASIVRLADWAGPTKRHRSRPNTQNAP